MGLTKFFRRFPASIGQALVGISGSKTVMAGDNIPFAHSDEFIAVSHVDSTRFSSTCADRVIRPADKWCRPCPISGTRRSAGLALQSSRPRRHAQKSTLVMFAKTYVLHGANNRPCVESQVYRMHSLLPDKVEVFDAQKDKLIAVKDLSEIIFENGTAVNTSVPLQDLFFSLGVGHAGKDRHTPHLLDVPTCLQPFLKTSQSSSLPLTPHSNHCCWQQRCSLCMLHITLDVLHGWLCFACRCAGVARLPNSAAQLISKTSVVLLPLLNLC